MADDGRRLALEVAVPYCAAEDMGDEIVALNVESGIYFSVRGLGADLWRDLDAGHPLDDLLAHIGDETALATEAKAFVDQLLHYDLMRAAERGPASGAPKLVAALAAGPGEIVFEVFEDMKDLILSDPIHDVDETVGWPKRATPQV